MDREPSTTVIYESPSTRVTETVRNGEAVICKALKPGVQTPQAIARYQHEYLVNQSLTSPFISRAVDYDDRQHKLYFEAIPARSLREQLDGDPVKDFDALIQIAKNIAEALQSIHDEGVVHRDINPANILVSADLGVRIIDFGLATFAPHNHPDQHDIINHLAGTLPYVSPEQTGRVNRVVDYRTDLYALGATLYELFCGTPPFTHTDPLELIHAHIAGQPKPLTEVSQRVPLWLSDLVLKLLAKQPEERYQSAASVRDDLVEGQDMANIAPFRLAQTDSPGQLVLPKRLYGREAEINQLKDLLGRTERGEVLFVEVSGSPGVGKTALTDDLVRRALEQDLLVADTAAGNLAFTDNAQLDTNELLLELMRPLVRQALSLVPDTATDLLARLDRISSDHLTALLPFVPELGATLTPGEESKHPHFTHAVSPAAERAAISALLVALAPHPVCLVVTDVDQVVMNIYEDLLEFLVEHQHVMLVTSTRKPNVDAFAQPKIATKLTRLELEPLARVDIRNLLADMLSQSEARVRELAAEMWDKTDGLPAQVLELIYELHHAGAIAYDSSDGNWTWDLDAIRAHYFSNNSNERIASQLSLLPADARAMLQLGSCIGPAFEMSSIRGASDKDEAEIAVCLRKAIRQGLLGLSGTEYRFSHPRIAALIYAEIDDTQKSKFHFDLANHLSRTKRAEGSVLLSIADHLNAAADFCELDHATRLEIAHYNLLAGRESLQRSAFQKAYKYCRSGLALFFSKDPSHEPVYLELCQCAAEAAFLCGDFEQLSRVVEHTSETSSSMREVQLRAAIVRNELDKAKSLTESALLDLDYRPGQLASLGAKISRWMSWRGHKRLRAPLNELNDPKLQQQLRLICYLLHVQYHLGEGLLETSHNALELVNRANAYSAEVAVIFAMRAIEQLNQGYDPSVLDLANNARLIANQAIEDSFATRTLTLLSGLVDPWSKPIDQTLKTLSRNIEVSMEHKDYEFAATACAFFATNGLLRGMELGSLGRELKKHVETVSAYNHVTAVNIAFFVTQMVHSLTGNLFDQDDSNIPGITNPDDKVALGYVYALRLYYAFLFHDIKGAQGVLEQAQELMPYLKGSPLHITFALIEGLLAVRDPKGKRTVLACINRLQSWTAHGAAFAEPKLSLLLAEKAWAEGHKTRALEIYEQAAELAKQQGLANDEALAYELAARACHADDRLDFAKLFMHNAHQAYLRWGATAKSNQLERNFEGLLQDVSSRPNSQSLSVSDLVDLTVRDYTATSSTSESTELSDRLLDTTTVLRAAQTISGEILLDRVLTKLLRLALEHAGAQRGAMLLANESGELFLEALAAVDGEPTRRISPAEPLHNCTSVPISVIQFVARTQELLVLSDATSEDVFTQDPYVIAQQPLSVLCLPILHRGELTGALYVEHKWLSGMFTEKRIEVLTLLASQAAISIENARLYADLHEARDEYQALYENAIEGLFQLSPQGELVQANPTLGKILGFENVDSMVNEYRDLLDHIFHSRDAAGEFISALEERNVVSAFEAQGVTREGQVFWMSLTAQLHDDHGQGAMIDGSLIDISERKEREQADKQRQVAEAATEAKSEFLANMSHEIRTPMNAILGFSKLALESNLDRKQHEYLTSIRNAAENLLNLVSDVLDFSKIEAGKLIIESEPFQFGETLIEVKRLFRTELRKKQLQLVIDNHAPLHPHYPDDDTLQGDALRLQQILVNLVGNAIKFTEAGEIRIQSSVREATADGLLIQIDVQDSGIGITQEQQGRLFNSFEQAEGSITRRYGGTGLGLAICKQLVEAMGGTIRVESVPGEGSVFSFTTRYTIPSEAEATAAALSQRKRIAQPDVLKGRRLLVAEDNPINQQLALEFLQRGGAIVEIADNGRIAVAMITENEYDAVLMDIHMPEMDGLEATRILREQNIRIPIVAVSADALEERQNQALELGCDGYVTKPIDFDKLLIMLEDLLPITIDPSHSRRASDQTLSEQPSESEPIADINQLEAIAAPQANTNDVADSSNTNELEDASMPLSNIPRIPGIDIADALRGHNGNVKLMMKLMGDFGNYYGDAGSRIRTFIQAKQYEDAERLAHNLHGVAGSFGAARLKEASKTLELALLHNEEANLVGLAQSFEIALSEVLESADALASNEIEFRASDYE